MNRIVKKITNAYYMIYTLTILSTIIGYLLIQNKEAVDVKSQLSITISSLVIIYIFISIPAAILCRCNLACIDSWLWISV